MFPQELIEKILTYCDGKTLLTALEVDEVFEDRVRYLTKTSDIWKYCCNEEIPRNELLEYFSRFCNCLEREKWLRIYEKWISWKNIKNVTFAFLPCPVEIPRITCLNVTGRYIAVGSEDGRVRIFNNSWECLGIQRYASGKVSDVKFIWCDEKNQQYPLILVAYQLGSSIFIGNSRRGDQEPYLLYHDVLKYSVYNNYLCIVRRGGRINIDCLMLAPPFISPTCELVAHLRIYASNEVTCVNLWKSICTFVLHDEVKVVRYEKDIQQQQLQEVENKASLDYFKSGEVFVAKYTYIFRDDLVITLTNDTDNEEVMEIFIMDQNNSVTKKSFDSWAVLKAVITCIYLYGNTLIIGDNTGCVYFYEVGCWKKFDLKNHKKHIFLGPHPILCIDSVDTVDRRMFYVASSYRIHVIECSNVSKLKKF